MESALTNACTIKIQNFEGPFDLLFHLIEKNQVNIYDIPINEITDQYMEYLFAMKELDLEIASEFLVMAATLLHIKSKLLLPEKKEKNAEEIDPREELVLKLIEYKKYKDFSVELRLMEEQWDKVYYKLPEVMEFECEEELLELSPEEIRTVYIKLLEKNRKKMNNTVNKMATIIQHEKVSLKGKMREVLLQLFKKTQVIFTDIFSLKTRTRTEVVTGFLAILELSKLKKVKLEQQKQFSDIIIHRCEGESMVLDEDKVAVDN
ncbi:MAG: segregation/condensation protein A [Bacillota bacterium]|nr:segregation/condensation protein A [Bacillota bacterium]